MQSETAVQPSYMTTRLSKGRHTSPRHGVCVMELSSMLAGEPFTDHPASVCPVIGALLRGYNDTIDDDRRQDLYAYASLAVGTRAGSGIERERISAALAWSSARRPGPLHRLPRLLRRHHDLYNPHVAANAVIRALGKRIGQKDHRSFLSLIDELCKLGAQTAAIDAAAGPDQANLPTPACSRRS